MRATISLIVLMFISTLVSAQYAWTPRSDVSTVVRGHGVAFSIGGKGYVTTGNSNGQLLNDLWEYDPNTDSWTQKASFPGIARYDAVSFVINGIGYVGLGWNGGFGNYKDFWAYNPSTNTWTQKATYPGNGARNAAGAAVGGKGYVGGGHISIGPPHYSDFYEYDPVADTWTSKTSFPFGGRVGAVALGIGNYVYFFGGQNGSASYSDLWRFDPSANSWSPMPNRPGLPYMQGVAFQLNNKGYFGLGHTLNGGYPPTDTIYEYDPVNASWSMIPTYPPGSRTVPISFSIGNKAFVGTGRDANGGHVVDFYEYSDLEAVGIEAEAPSSTVLAYPNPTSDVINFNLSGINIEGGIVDLFDSRGKKIISQLVPAGMSNLRLSLANLPNGTYYYTVRIHSQETVTTGKILLVN